jgi:hypothetical protein
MENFKYTFAYNKALMAVLKKSNNCNETLNDVHYSTLAWLSDNLDEHKDYKWRELDDRRADRAPRVFIRSICFAHESDLLAFRLACGV